MLLDDSSTGNRWQPPTDNGRNTASVRTRDERDAMVEYLFTLTDSTFLTAEKLSDPFRS